MADENGVTSQQSATYNGKEYRVIREGLAEILKPRSPTEQNGGGPKSQTVFYNPIQQFNRDLSVLAIRVFAEDLAIIRRRREERASGKAKHRGNKRKRPDEGQHAEHATTPSGKLQKASIDGEQQTNGIPEELDNNSNAVNWAPTGKSSSLPSDGSETCCHWQNKALRRDPPTQRRNADTCL